MKLFDDATPIFQQVAEVIERDIVQGVYGDDDPLPSTNELAVFYRINPATAAKGLNLLVSQQIAYKKRGIGMFVNRGARDRLVARKKQEFVDRDVRSLTSNARALGIDLDALCALIAQEYPHD